MAAILLGAAAPHATLAQQDAVPATPDSAVAPYRVEVVGFIHQVDRGYGSWRGTEVRLRKVGPRFTPAVFVSAQTRPEGTQMSLGASSYVILNDWSYLILGAGTAPEGSAELYPRLRWDVTGLVNVPRVPGLSFRRGSRTPVRAVGRSDDRLARHHLLHPASDLPGGGPLQ